MIEGTVDGNGFCFSCYKKIDVMGIVNGYIHHAPCGCQFHPETKEPVPKNDPVEHPKHYTNSPSKCSKCSHPIECIDVTRHMGFNLGNAVKYIWRYADKNGLQDLAKAQWYLNDFIEKEKQK